MAHSYNLVKVLCYYFNLNLVYKHYLNLMYAEKSKYPSIILRIPSIGCISQSEFISELAKFLTSEFLSSSSAFTQQRCLHLNTKTKNLRTLSLRNMT